MAQQALLEMRKRPLAAVTRAPARQLPASPRRLRMRLQDCPIRRPLMGLHPWTLMRLVTR